jgi:hypothetical protein
MIYVNVNCVSISNSFLFAVGMWAVLKRINMAKNCYGYISTKTRSYNRVFEVSTYFYLNDFRQQLFLALGICGFYVHGKLCKFGNFRTNKFIFTANKTIMSPETSYTAARVPQQCIYLWHFGTFMSNVVIAHFIRLMKTHTAYTGFVQR